MCYRLFIPRHLQPTSLLRYAFIPALLISLSTACGTSQSVQPAPRPQAVKPKPVAKVVDYSAEGRPVALGSWAKIVGYNTVWVQGTSVLITLKTTAWDEIDGAREGRATLIIGQGAETKTIVMQEGQTRTIAGLQLEVKTAFEEYLEGRYEPMVELKASR